jgi:nucleoside phosphorylase
MTYRSADDFKAEATHRGMRRAIVVTALPSEMEAVRGHLTELSKACSERDGTIFECGVFAELGEEWLVVVESGAGTHPAQSAATYAHTGFAPFEVQILVGVGGSRKEEGPIGTVVASDLVNMPSAKYGPKERSFRPRTFPVDNRLVNIAKKVRRDGVWQSRIKPPYNGTLPTEMPTPSRCRPKASSLRSPPSKRTGRSRQ